MRISFFGERGWFSGSCAKAYKQLNPVGPFTSAPPQNYWWGLFWCGDRMLVQVRV